MKLLESMSMLGWGWVGVAERSLDVGRTASKERNRGEILRRVDRRNGEHSPEPEMKLPDT